MTDLSTARSRVRALVDLIFGHDGRIGRLHYWVGLAATAGIIAFLASMAEDIVPGTGDIGRYVTFFFILGLFIWMHSAVTVKRLHDRDHSGLWYFIYGLGPPGFLLWAVVLHAENKYATALPLYAISLLGFLWVTIELGFMRGSSGPNRFGRELQITENS